MPKIPLYQRQATTSTQGTAVEMNPQVAASSFQAMANLGGTATKVALEMNERRKQLKQEADWSDYEVRKRKLVADIESGKAKAITNGDATISNVNEIVVAPLLEEFEAQNLNQQYSKNSYRRIGQNWNVSRQAIETEGALEQAQLETQEYVSRIETHLGNLLTSGGDYSEQEAALNDAIGTVKTTEKISELRASAYNNQLTTILTSAQSGEIGAEVALTKIEELNDSNSRNQTNPKRRMATQNTLNSAEASIKGNATKERAKTVQNNAKVISDLVNAGATGEVDTDTIRTNLESLGREVTDKEVEEQAAAVGRGAKIWREKEINRGDKFLPKIQREIVKVADGKKTSDEAMKAIKADVSDYVAQFSDDYTKKELRDLKEYLITTSNAQLASTIYSNIDKQNTVALYDAGVFAKQRSAPLKGIYADGQRRIADYLATGGSDPEWVSDTGLFLTELARKEHTMEEEEVTAEFNAHFAKQATRIWKKKYTNIKTAEAAQKAEEYKEAREAYTSPMAFSPVGPLTISTGVQKPKKKDPKPAKKKETTPLEIGRNPVTGFSYDYTGKKKKPQKKGEETPIGRNPVTGLPY